MKLSKEQIFNSIVILFLLLFLFTPVGFFLKVQLNKLISFSPSTLPEKEQLPLQSYQWNLNATDGAEFALTEAKGKVVFINFWATWCPPCVAEMPDLQELYNQYKDDVVFLFVANDEREKVQNFMQKKGYRLPVYYENSAPPKDLEHPSIPTTYVIDKEGKIVLKKVGAASWNSEAMFETLDALLK